MKKTNYLFIILAFAFLITNAYGQKPAIVLTFKAKIDFVLVPVENIYIENLTKGGDTTINFPNNSLVLNYIIGIEETEGVLENTLSISQNRPNPFTEQTAINIFMPEPNHLRVSVTNLMGQRIASYENSLAAGNHSFVFYPGADKYYILSASANGMVKSIKMICQNRHSSKSGSLVFQGSEEIQVDHKSTRNINGFGYSFGDTLRFTGMGRLHLFNDDIGSDMLVDAPEADKTYTFHFEKGIPCLGEPSVMYAAKQYNTVLIGNHCWFKENLNVGSQITGSLNQTNNSNIEKYCYDNDPVNCTTYGGIYQWDEMMQYSTEEGAQGICPDGWHIPSFRDLCLMSKYIDITVDCSVIESSGTNFGTKMKSSTGWTSGGNGTDSYGFTALPAGYRSLSNYNFYDKGGYGHFWSSTVDVSNQKAWWYRLGYNANNLYKNIHFKGMGFSVRCMRDVGIPCNGVSTVTDDDGNVYNTVSIGTQCWMKENLNVGTQILSLLPQTQNDIIEKYCYGNIPFSCGEFGGLYQWFEMMGAYKSTTEHTQGICPTGWHIPSDEEWKLLYGTVDSQYPVDDPEWDNSDESKGYDAGLKLKSSEGWISGNGTDEFSFTGLPTGCSIPNGSFNSPSDGYYWSSMSSSLWQFTKLINNSNEIDFSGSLPTLGYAVRCLKD